jgi:uncharacterized protein YdhG (YjbR/CyaY superfamily)
MSVIDELLDKYPEAQRVALEHVRQVIYKQVPGVEEVMTYGMPGFKYQKKYLISFASFKDHMSLFPGSEAVERLGSKLKGYTTSKGTIQFTLEKPLPDEVIQEIVAMRKADIEKKK